MGCVSSRGMCLQYGHRDITLAGELFVGPAGGLPTHGGVSIEGGLPDEHCPCTSGLFL